MEDCPPPACTIIMVQMLISLHDTTAGFRIRPVFHNLHNFWTCQPLSFFFEFCHKAGNFEELNEFLSKNVEFIEDSEVFLYENAMGFWKRYFRAEIF